MLLKVSDCPFDGVCVCLREKDRESERESVEQMGIVFALAF